VDSFGCPLDSDKDGVYDYLDKCPGTPRGVKVDSKGCPLDSDGDGVFDSMDKCPDTPKGVKVDKTGCPLVMDGDGDGVPDSVDKCPRTPKGATVNEFGCWICEDINFDFNKWEIKPEFHKSLDDQVSFLKQNTELIVEVQGHTDNLGTKEANQLVSERRANSVRDYFIQKGVPAKRLIAKGYDYTVPLTSNDTKEGRAKNRRVQLSVCYDLMVE
jgi:OOP family OmpA-OmpF porin